MCSYSRAIKQKRIIVSRPALNESEFLVCGSPCDSYVHTNFRNWGKMSLLMCFINYIIWMLAFVLGRKGQRNREFITSVMPFIIKITCF